VGKLQDYSSILKNNNKKVEINSKKKYKSDIKYTDGIKVIINCIELQHKSLTPTPPKQQLTP